MHLDPQVCYQAIQSRDPRFDGQFFVGVQTTGIFCRPICPAITPKYQHCQFFCSAAAAQAAGFRPCLRCRPELAPRLWPQITTASTVRRALDLIEAGALDRGSVTALARRLGVGARHLRQLFQEHLGLSPVAVAQTRRLLFAKQLLGETALSMTDVALAAGYSSVRRFNESVRRTYGRPPSDLRRGSPHSPEIELKLPYSAPYHWQALLAFWGKRAIPGVEQVDTGVEAGVYRRTIRCLNSTGSPVGWVEIRSREIKGISQPYLLARIVIDNVQLLSPIVERLRQMLDVSAPIAEIEAHLKQDPLLASLVAQHPGLRVPGAWDPFEMAVRAILGQQISVAAATTLAGRLAESLGEPVPGIPGLERLFPTPHQLAEADPAHLNSLGISKSRSLAITRLAQAVVRDPELLMGQVTLDETVRALCQLPGIGTWTAHVIAMRALREPDAFPGGDLGLIRRIEQLGSPLTRQQLEAHAQGWRPWRAYAAMHLWATANPSFLSVSLSA
ncbi:MAG: DNA-3-methyladenine glycosylase 2 family protein [Thermostichus sp. BF3_bins_97]